MKTKITKEDFTKEASITLTLAELKALFNLLNEQDSSLITYREIKGKASEIILENN